VKYFELCKGKHVDLTRFIILRKAFKSLLLWKSKLGFQNCNLFFSLRDGKKHNGGGGGGGGWINKYLV
jgi:hypothetical protein